MGIIEQSQNINMNDYSELVPLQEKQLEILSYVKTFCDQYDIKWVLSYGSALGARRHGGHIPWDDDIDISMTSEEYNKFRELFFKYGDQDRFYLQERICVDGMYIMPKLRMNGTTFIEESIKDLDIHHGIYIDIFILHHAPMNPISRLYGFLLNLYLCLKLLSDQGYNKRKAVKPVIILLQLLPKNFGLKYILKFQYKYDCKDSDYLTDWCLLAKFIDKNYIFPTKNLMYDEIEVYVPNQIEKYLELLYGEWQKLPDIENIKWSQHAYKWSASEDFRKYTKNVINFSDEMGAKINRKV